MVSKTPYIILFQEFATSKKAIHVAEEGKEIPFNIKRTYWITAKNGAIDVGNHAHRRLSQVFVAIHGSIEVHLKDTAGQEHHYTLNNPNTGLYVPPLYWKWLKLSDDAVLLCLTSHLFDEEDYIKNLEEFLSISG